MAITWNFHLISSKCISLNTISDIVRKYQSTIGVKDVFSIDDWTWNNRQELQSILDINEKLAEGKIVIADLEWNGWKAAGVYIENEEDYLYTLWMNTEGIPELDKEIIDYRNREYYEQAYQCIREIVKEHSIDFTVIAIGLESDILHSGDVQEMIKASEHVVTWIINDCLDIDFSMERYQKRTVEEWNVVIWEMRQS